MAQTRRDQRRDEILEAALAVSDREGLDGLTIRRVCDELGVTAPILYRYFRDKDELVEQLVRRLLSAPEVMERGDQALRPWLRGALRRMRATWLEHPSFMAMMVSSEFLRGESLKLAEEMVAGLRAAGLDARGAGAAFHTLMSYMLGSVTLARGTRMTDLRPELAALPTLASSRTHLDPTEQGVFDEGLDRLLDLLLPAAHD